MTDIALVKLDNLYAAAPRDNIIGELVQFEVFAAFSPRSPREHQWVLPCSRGRYKCRSAVHHIRISSHSRRRHWLGQASLDLRVVARHSHGLWPLSSPINVVHDEALRGGNA